MSPFILKFVPLALRVVKIVIVIAPHAVTIYRQIQAQRATAPITAFVIDNKSRKPTKRKTQS